MWRCGTCISVIAVVKSLCVYNNSCISVAVAGKGITTVFQSPNSKVRGPGYNTRAFIATFTLHRHFDSADHAFITQEMKGHSHYVWQLTIGWSDGENL